MLYTAKVTDFLSIDPTTIVLVLINTLILFLILKHFLFDRVNKVIESRQNDVAEIYKNADEAQKDAEKLKEEYTQKLSSAKEESAQIVSDATKRAQSRSDEIIADAKAEAKSILDNADEQIQREKKLAVNQIKNDITEIAFSAAEAVIAKDLSSDDNEKLIESFIENVGEK
ncbi:MAG: F0F1 ATP synthase subunit B [Oscillospiraceae bacterium]